MPATAAALLIADGTWDVQRMVNVEELPCRPFIDLLGRMGLPTHVREAGQGEDLLLEFEAQTA